jgi:N-acetylglucosaminyldiphosphoundecaprenol N-acetyl-beta-D-mannosaminyltransferase
MPEPTAGEKRPVFGVGVTVTDYARATAAVLAAAEERRSFGLTALATHGLMIAAEDPEFARVIAALDVVTPDGQPVRWALNRFHDAGLDDRVYGPDLTWKVCEHAARRGIGIYLFGSRPETCEAFAANLRTAFPDIAISGVQPDRFRDATAEEDAEDIARMNDSGAGIVLVGRGCPRQERWVAAHLGSVHAAMLAVGAAFDYHAGTLAKPPAWMQRYSLEWLFRLTQDPKRLWRRYLTYNSKFALAALRELLRRRSRARST